jgi:anti-anti-sigma factor
MLLQLARTTEPRGFRLVGEMDISNVATFAEAMSAEIELGGDITLDLAGLAFLDSTGIQVIIQTAQRLEGRGRLRLVQPGDLVRRTLERVRLGQISNVDVIEDDGAPEH